MTEKSGRSSIDSGLISVPRLSRGEDINNSGTKPASNATPNTGGTLSDSEVQTPNGKFACLVEKAVRSLDRCARRKSLKKRFWHEEDSPLSRSCVGFRGDGLEPPRNEALDSLIAKGTPARDEKEMRFLLQNSEHLHLLRNDEVDDVIRSSLRREYLPGEVVHANGGRAQHTYVVVWGEVDVFDPGAAAALPQQRRSPPPQPLKQHLAPVCRRPTPGNSGVICGVGETKREERQEEWEKHMTHCGTVKPGMLFGFKLCLFNDTSTLRYVAGHATDRTVVILLPLPLVQRLLERNTCFAQSIGRHIAEKEIFVPVREFCRYVFSPAAAMNEYLSLWKILERYTKIENVIHTKLASNEIDTSAWGYALKRLPENVTTTFCFDLVLALPPFVATRMREEAKMADVRHSGKDLKNTASKRTAVTYIRTKERRRCTWHLGMEGKTLVLLRDGFTDLLDFIMMLCVHIIESNKLRSRVQGMVHPPAIDVLDDYLRQREAEENAGINVAKEVELLRVKKLLATMPLTKEEQTGLLANWHTECLVKIYEVMMHREEFNVRVDPSVSRRFQLNPFHEWALNLRDCIMEKMGMDRNLAPPDDLCIDVVSSNTHCIKNLLSSFHRKNRRAVEEYALSDRWSGKVSEWHTLEDALYAATAGFLASERPDLKEEYANALDESGITVLTDTAMTGLQVDVIPVHSLNFEMIDTVLQEAVKKAVTDGKPSNAAVWRYLCQPRKGGMSCRRKDKCDSNEATCSRLERHFIINMDFAFGAQAAGICQAIFGVFGPRIRSVNVIGKAGGLVGKRGDIQLPTEVLMSKSSLIMEDSQDELRRCRNQGLTAERLRELAGPRVEVHEGRMLTIAGTMLQNVRMLKFYKYIWGCVGTEMEGSYFARVIEDFYRQGIARKDLVTRFAYYTSDLPLGGEVPAVSGRATLAAPMTQVEGVPPLYAIARGLLENILYNDSTKKP
ncbi:cyclic nucleotide-binding protein [Trypanosoma grayi]|uniref:cyclic nucleotide-binding protein n=1 Tax=Trypanosoma grayi TaxID=71804 RepID=UPI0004F435CF|nr:cyclic nucleotide-binding protein [Trypanosoma grayi]KEG09615.1 cyclic nucleotide-binding protein [Trypanosoma grayi]